MHDFAAESIAAAFLVDACVIRRPADKAAGSFNRSTLQTTFTAGEKVYSGACAVEAQAADRVQSDAGSRRVVERFVLDLPASAEGTIRVGDIVVLDASASAGLRGRRFRIVRVFAETTTVTRRFELELATQTPAATGS